LNDALNGSNLIVQNVDEMVVIFSDEFDKDVKTPGTQNNVDGFINGSNFISDAANITLDFDAKHCFSMKAQLQRIRDSDNI
jgi:hypothetical protein